MIAEESSENWSKLKMHVSAEITFPYDNGISLTIFFMNLFPFMSRML